MSEATADELMAITASRLLADHRVVFAGVGMPLLASALARRRQAPNLTIVLEGGIIGTSLLPGSCRSRPTRCGPPTARRC